MIQSITRTIRHRGGHLYDGSGRCRDSAHLRKMGVFVPRGPYKVTYRLDATGPLCAKGNWVEITPYRGYFVCFLLEAWFGMRMRRTVRRLSAKAKA